MPELPDVEGVRRHLARHAEGERIVRLEAPDRAMLRNRSPRSLVPAVPALTSVFVRRSGGYATSFWGVAAPGVGSWQLPILLDRCTQARSAGRGLVRDQLVQEARPRHGITLQAAGGAADLRGRDWWGVTPCQ